jgi:hypothetical protein
MHLMILHEEEGSGSIRAQSKIIGFPQDEPESSTGNQQLHYPLDILLNLQFNNPSTFKALMPTGRVKIICTNNYPCPTHAKFSYTQPIFIN